MNLRKALDRAKRERQEEISISDEEVALHVEPASSEKGNGPGAPWRNPAYAKSSHVQFDRETLVKNRCVCINQGAKEIDNYKVLRTRIMQKSKEKGWNTLMVTSAQPGEGKTLTAINLAITLAREFNQTVLLVDCDLRKQDVHARFGYHSDKGLGDFLLNDCSLNEIISWPGVEKMTIISGGQTIQDTTELLGSQQMKSLVAEMKARYADRYVIFDLPSLLEGADAITFAPLVDGILLVAQAGRNSAKEINQALSLIPQEKFLGFVLNRQN